MGTRGRQTFSMLTSTERRAMVASIVALVAGCIALAVAAVIAANGVDDAFSLGRVGAFERVSFLLTDPRADWTMRVLGIGSVLAMVLGAGCVTWLSYVADARRRRTPATSANSTQPPT